jgi:ABC-type multidrug transport system fused ATPase/permease subunit
LSTFVRLLGFLRPYRAGAAWSLVLAAFAMGATVAIPWLTGRGIDAVTRGDEADVKLYAGVVVLAALARLALSVARRLISGRVSLGVELDQRHRL